MTNTLPRPHPPQPTILEEPPAPTRSNWRSSVLAPVSSALATLSAATALTGVVAGSTWLGYAAVSVVLVACTGLALRTMRTPTVVVGLCQLAVLTFLVTGVFTSSGIAAIIPGPAAFSQLKNVLTTAFEQIRIGLPPVEANPPILCLVAIAIGLIAIVVDALAVAASAPAASGLVLLCVYAVPASLADQLLPWWTFVVGAAAFAFMLAVNGNHRHRSWRNRDTPGLGGSATSASVPVVLACLSLVLGLIASATITGIGTVGRLPGAAKSAQDAGAGGLGIRPFTSLRGMLEQGDNTELFQVSGLGDEKHLLRAFTLDTYTANQGWGLPPGPMPAGVPANEPLPHTSNDDANQPKRDIRIDPVNWVDVWLPVYGSPTKLHNLPPGWFYDQTSDAVFNERKQRPPSYSETAALGEPTKDQLREAAPRNDDVPPVYTAKTQIDRRMSGLAKQLTTGKDNNFDKASAIWHYFTAAQSGFTYDTQTAEATDPDALTDFVFNGKRGYCEQFASAMGVMLRSLDIPSRIAVGFTPGSQTGDHRTISSQDAHAWVEIYFGDLGWVSFDPTPLSDGRGYVPEYLQQDQQPHQQPTEQNEDEPNPPSSQQPAAGAPEQGTAEQQTQANDEHAGAEPQSPHWSLWTAVVLAIFAAAVTALGIILTRRRPERTETTGGYGKTVAPATVASWLPLTAGGLWIAAAGCLGGLVSFWFAITVLLALGTMSAPAIIRTVTRGRRIAAITASTPEAAESAWREIRDECADRSLSIPPTETIRTAARKIDDRYQLDESGNEALRTIVTAIERAWYAQGAEEAGVELASAFEQLRHSLHRAAPLTVRARLFPKSVVNRGSTESRLSEHR